MIIEKVAWKLAEKINNFTENKDVDVDLVGLRLAMYLHFVLIVSISLVISLFLHKTLDMILAITLFVTIRRLTGGFHLPTLESCAAFSVALLVGIVAVDVGNIQTANIISFVLIAMFSYHRDKKSLILALILVAANTFIQSKVMAYSLFAQSITLLPLFGGESSMLKKLVGNFEKKMAAKEEKSLMSARKSFVGIPKPLKK